MRRLAALVTFATMIASPSAQVALADAPVPAAKRVQIFIDRSKVDLVGHTLQATMSRPAAKVHLKVTGESGAVLSETDIPFDSAPPKTPLTCTWTPSSDETVAKIEVFGYAPDGYWAGIQITPWKADIPHEEVNFATDSAVIADSEVGKLQASLKAIGEIAGKHTDVGPITLYIAGNTDTVGSAEHNFDLSRRRARAIGAWFKEHGVHVPVAYEGFGESSPRVATADQVDEPKNRRVDYVISASPPSLPSTTLAWHSL